MDSLSHLDTQYFPCELCYGYVLRGNFEPWNPRCNTLSPTPQRSVEFGSLKQIIRPLKQLSD
jgi:hypothetical protein